MENAILEKRKALKPLGTHTAVGRLHELDKWKDVPYLKDNNGMLPPFIIAVGSRERVKKAPDVLQIKDPAFIDEIAQEIAGLDAYGRVALLVGVVKGRIEFPLAIVETQMGCPATQINLKEILYFTRDDGYSWNKKKIKTSGIYVVRAGTAGGVNSHSSDNFAMSIGDIAIGTESYGSIGAILQSKLSILDFASVNAVERTGRCIKDVIRNSLYVSHDLKYLKTLASVDLLCHLKAAAEELKLNAIAGPNFTKDSLYAEMGEEKFAELRNAYGVISTEMEQMIIDVVAAEFREKGIYVGSGLVSAIIGAIPGKSFPETEKEKRAAKEAEANTLRLAAKAFERIAQNLSPVESNHK
ncbi:MAG: hypothetical protein QXT45_02515 [Candidatus Bilamarchaeaceae archaeon]